MDEFDPTLVKKSQSLIQNSNIEFIQTSVIILREYLQQLSPTTKEKNNKKPTTTTNSKQQLSTKS